MNHKNSEPFLHCEALHEIIREWERNRILPKHLVTIKKASEITGSSTSFFKQLIREKKLTRYKINTATFVSLIEFEYLAITNLNK